MAFVTVVALAVPPAPARARDERVTVVAQIPASGANGGAYIDATARRLYLADATKVRILDVDTFAELAVIPVGSSVAAVDEVAHLLYVGITGGPSTPATIAVIDGIGLRALPTRIPVPTGPIPNPVPEGIFGLSVSPDRKIIAAVSPFTAGAGAGIPVVLVQLDIEETLAGTAAPEWTYTVEGCTTIVRTLGNLPGIPADPDSRSVYIPCSYPTTGSVTMPRARQGMFKVERSRGSSPPLSASFTPIAGDFQFGGALFDPVSERTVLFTRRFGPQGALVYDGHHDVVMGLVAQSGNLGGACVNAATGRYYAVTDTLQASLTQGLLIGELRATPVPQGTAIVELNDHLASGRMACDPPTNRAFYYDHRDGERVLTVVRDNIPAYIQPSKLDPDALTSDVPEGPSTSVTYNGFGRAYGARLIEVGGPDRVGSSFIAPFSGITTALGLTRSLSFAAVGVDSVSVALSNQGAAAAATAARRDTTTVADMTQNGSQPDSWPYPNAACSRGTGTEAADESVTGANAACDPAGGVAKASSTADGAVGPVVITGAASDVVVRVDPERGVVTTATATVRSIAITNASVVLENITATAESAAKGRPGTASAVYSSNVGRLLVNGDPRCVNCDPAQVAAILNALPQHTVVATVPKADADLRRGSPKGASAAIVREQFEQLNDQVLNEAPADDQQVPALRIAIQADNFQHAALILDLAAPEAGSLRAISPCSFCEDIDPGPGFIPPEAPTVIPVINPPAPIDDGGDGRGDGENSRKGGIVRRIIEGSKAIARGIRAALASPGRIPLLILVWSVFAAPVYLSSRRRLLVVNTNPEA